MNKRTNRSKYTTPYHTTNYFESGYNSMFAGGDILSLGTGLAGNLVQSTLGDTTEGNVASGALKGASSGAMLGSVVPGIGTGIGAGVGALVGGVTSLIGSNKAKKAENERIKQINSQYAYNQGLAQSDPMLDNSLNQSFKCGGKMRKYPKGGDANFNQEINTPRKYSEKSVIQPYTDPFSKKQFYVVKGTSDNIKRKDVFPVDTEEGGTSIMYGTYTEPRTPGSIAEYDYIPTTFRTYKDDKSTQAYYPSSNLMRLAQGKNPYNSRTALANYSLLEDPNLNPLYTTPSATTAMKAKGGNITEYNGYTHENGGIPLTSNVEVETGETRGIQGTSTEDYIFSDRLKPVGSKKTFADVSKKINKRYSLRPWDKISKDAKDRELNTLMQEHELVKSLDEAKIALKRYKKGGYIKMAPGGDLESLSPLESPAQLRLPNTQSYTDVGTGNLATNYIKDNTVAPKEDNIFQKAAQFAVKNPELISAGVQGLGLAGKQRYVNKLKSNYIPIQGVDYKPLTNDEEIRAIDTGYRGAENAAANYTDSGSYMNRMLAIDAAKTNQKAGAMERLRNTNAQGRLQTSMFNKGIESQNDQVRRAEQDALDSVKLGMYDDWSNYLTGVTNTLSKKKAFNDMMDIEAAKYPNYEMAQDKWGRKKFRLKNS